MYILINNFLYRQKETPHKEAFKCIYAVYEGNESESRGRVYLKRECRYKPNSGEAGKLFDWLIIFSVYLHSINLYYYIIIFALHIYYQYINIKIQIQNFNTFFYLKKKI